MAGELFVSLHSNLGGPKKIWIPGAFQERRGGEEAHCGPKPVSASDMHVDFGKLLLSFRCSILGVIFVFRREPEGVRFSTTAIFNTDEKILSLLCASETLFTASGF